MSATDHNQQQPGAPSAGGRPGGRGRTQLLLMFGVGFGSLFGAWLLFSLARDGGFMGTTNRGVFVDPPIAAEALELTRLGNVADGAAAGSQGPFVTGGVWWLWVVPDRDCGASLSAAGAACEEALFELRQLHVLLNRDADRVRRALLTDTATRMDGAALAERFPRLEALSGNLGRLEPGVYVVDPIGNLVFRYPLANPGDAVLDDLKRLLKVSQIG